MLSLRFALLAPTALLATSVGASEQKADPLRFFEGRTETQGTVKVMFKKPYKTRCVGVGRIESDGSLALVQRVEDEGKPAHERRWRVRESGPDRYVAAMSEATGPVAIDKVGERYRFRFRMKGNLTVEQWLTPLAGGNAARTTTSVRKLGMTVATSDGTVRRLPAS